jgi:hypothetical protein
MRSFPSIVRSSEAERCHASLDCSQVFVLASDNCAGICPEALAALVEANRGHAAARGNDAWTERADARPRETPMLLVPGIRHPIAVMREPLASVTARTLRTDLCLR